MARLQLALNVNDIDAAVDFYTTLFHTEPAKRRPGYANFAIDNPSLKLILFENPEQSGTLNHLGVERESLEEVEAEANLLEAAGLSIDVKGDVTCCYARQDKHWVTGPDGQQWENYVVLADAHPELEGNSGEDLSALALDTLIQGNEGPVACCAGSADAASEPGHTPASSSACC